MPNTWYLDFENGNDTWAGDSFAAGHPWATITGGPTAAHGVAAGDTIHIAKSSAPTSIGSATWTDRSKTVTLDAAQTTTVDLCETAWTAVTGLITVLNATPTNGGAGYAVNDTFNITTGGTGATGKVTAQTGGVVTAVALVAGGNGGYTTGTGKVTAHTSGSGNDALTVNITTVAVCTVTRQAVGTGAKEGSYSMKIAAPTAVKLGSKLAYYAITPGTLAGYQKLSFWIYSSVAITAGQWRIVLCSGATGETIVDEFLIPAIPSAGVWIPLTITKTGGGNLGASTASIAIYADTVAPTSASYIVIDAVVACTTSGLNLQSLISLNSAAYGGTEGWFAIQSINGVTVLLDNDNSFYANAGRGYSGAGGYGETWKRETIKMPILAYSDCVNIVQVSGTVGNTLSFIGGYNISTDTIDGETFIDGFNSYGYGINIPITKDYITISGLCGCRFYYFLLINSSYNAITTTNCNNNNNGIVVLGSCYCTLVITNANNCLYNGVQIASTSFCHNIDVINANSNGSSGIGSGIVVGGSSNILRVTNLNNNIVAGVTVSGHNNIIRSIVNANYNNYGLSCAGINNRINSISTSDNITASIYHVSGNNYIRNGAFAESTVVSMSTTINGANLRIFSENQSGSVSGNWIYTSFGTINSLATDRVGGTGIMWKLSPTSSSRNSYYPLNLSVAKIAVAANKLVTVKAYMKLTSTTDILGALVCRVGQIAWSDGTADVKTNMGTADADWHEVTITFTPTAAGVVEIEAWAWWVASTADESVYIEDMTITQAA
jgi:hypothetical protein